MNVDFQDTPKPGDPQAAYRGVLAMIQRATKHSPVRGQELMQVNHLSSPGQITAIVRAARHCGVPVASSRARNGGRHAGYWLARTPEELDASIGYIQKTARSTLQTAVDLQRCRRALEKAETQSYSFEMPEIVESRINIDEILRDLENL